MGNYHSKGNTRAFLCVRKKTGRDDRETRRNRGNYTFFFSPRDKPYLDVAIVSMLPVTHSSELYFFTILRFANDSKINLLRDIEPVYRLHFFFQSYFVRWALKLLNETGRLYLTCSQRAIKETLPRQTGTRDYPRLLQKKKTLPWQVSAVCRQKNDVER